MHPGQKVNDARRAAGITQRELAARSGVPQPAVARIERGQQIPRADTLNRLLEACGFELRLVPLGRSDSEPIEPEISRAPTDRLVPIRQAGPPQTST